MKLRRSTSDFFARLRVRSLGLRTALTVCVVLLGTVCQAQSIEWAVSAGGTLGDGTRDFAVDAAGNSYVVGRFSDTATFGPFTLTSPGEYDMFVAKYDGDGNVLWVDSAGQTEPGGIRGIDIDPAGNSYITGNFQGTVTFGPFTLTSADDRGTFLVKYDASGTVLWAQLGEGQVWDTVYSIGVDAAGNSYVIGHYHGTMTFGSFTLTSTGEYDIFVVKYDTSGNVLWARSGGGTESESVRGIAVDAAGNSYVTGIFRGTATFGSFTLTSAIDWDLFVVKYDAGGSVLWARSDGGETSKEYPWSIAVDDAGNSHVTGQYNETAVFGPFTLTSLGYRNIYVVKYDAGGDVLWARSAGGVNWTKGYAIAVDDAGISYVAGNFERAATFGPFTLTSTGAFDVFLAQYDGDGNVLWVNSGGGERATFSRGNGVGADAAGNSYMMGEFESTMTFDSLTLTSAGEEDIFVAKYGPGACCLGDSSCVQLGPSDCDFAGGTFSGGVCDDDVDGDGLDGRCGDPCPNDNPDDIDGDGVCDSDDPCPDDNPDDTDGDGVCDSDDPCPLDNPDDGDGDGVCDSDDPCPNDNPDDTDGDGVCDSVDACPGADDNLESDGDGVPDCLDQCPGVNDAVYLPECANAIPTVSTWGLVVLSLLLLIGGKLYFGRRHDSASES